MLNKISDSDSNSTHNGQLVIVEFTLAYSSNTKFKIIRHGNVIPISIKCQRISQTTIRIT